MRSLLISCLGAALLLGCTQQNPAETALGTNVPLTPASNLAGAATPGVRVWRAPDIAQYPASNFYIPPAQVDHGPGAHFAGVDPQQAAAILTEDVRRAVGQRFPVVDTPGPGTHTVQLILVSVTPPQQEYLSNGPYPWAPAVVGMPNLAATEGQMIVAGKFIVASTGKVLAAFVAPVVPNDVMMGVAPGTGGTMDFVHDAAQTFANQLAASIARQRELNRQQAGQS